MKSKDLHRLLKAYRSGHRSLRSLTEALAAWPYQELRFAKVDLHRTLRRRFPEVIFGQGKTAAQMVSIAQALHAAGSPVVITRVSSACFKRLQKELVWLMHFPEAGMAAGPLPKKRAGQKGKGRGRVWVVTAGTGDIPVAQEALVTLRLMGQEASPLFDVGVAGLHRLLKHLSPLRRARAIVVVAGMDGALPSVVSGLVSCPVVAVPTSVGYGASFKGVGPLLTMLNACSPGVAVTNIDNGFGAGYFAALVAGPQHS